jgi:thiosulfate/3-mercaptopyruvate sulfurtransferase
MNKKMVIISLLALAVISAGCGKKESTQTANGGVTGAASTPAAAAASKDSYPNAQLLADVAWTDGHKTDKNVKILDVRAKGYEQGHIPGAIAFNSGQLKDAKNNTIVATDKFTELFQGLGVNSDTTVLLYDEGNALNAARVFYALEYYGHQDKVKILNGGYAAWSSAAKEVSTDAPVLSKGNFTAKPNDKLVTTKDQIKTLDKQQCQLLDVRSAKEYTGEDLRNNQKGGHIPDAVNKEWSDAIATGADGVPTFKSAKDLKAAFDKIGIVDGKTVIPYCQTNIRGSHTYFTLRLLGYSDIRPYEGAWAEWGNAADTTAVK